MNYLSHAYRYLDRPYYAAGTALPDWMSLIDRKNRARRQFAEPVASHQDPHIADFARGVMQHHDDDRWFHGSKTFVEMSTGFAVELRALLQKGLGHQAGFAGHIIVELLLDAILIERHPELLDEYYSVFDSLDVHVVQEAANEICRKPVDKLVVLIPRFVQERFLSDYPEDGPLLKRINGVMRRVGLPEMPDSVVSWLATARPRVRYAADELLNVGS